jgi:hypothetical protein
MAPINEPRDARELLGLASNVVEGQLNFLLAYARELEQARQEDRDGPWGRLWRSTDLWAGWGTLATTYRLAAQFAFLSRPHLAATLLRRSAAGYLAAGLPFGLFLMSAAVTEADAGELLSTREHAGALLHEQSGFDPAALRDPVQQTYLLLAYASHPAMRREFQVPLRRQQEMLQGHALHPIGARGQPITRYLQLSSTMLRSSTGQEGPPYRTMARTLAALNQDEAESLSSARANTYLWERGAAPINYVDLEITALCAVIMRDVGETRRLSAFLADQVGDPLGGLNVWAATETRRHQSREQFGARSDQVGQWWQF